MSYSDCKPVYLHVAITLLLTNTKAVTIENPDFGQKFSTLMSYSEYKQHIKAPRFISSFKKKNQTPREALRNAFLNKDFNGASL